jgi:hypothetical protein
VLSRDPLETLELQKRDQIGLSKVLRRPQVTVAPLKNSCGAIVSEGGHTKRSTQAVKPLANRQAAARGVGTPKFGVWEAALEHVNRLQERSIERETSK